MKSTSHRPAASQPTIQQSALPVHQPPSTPTPFSPPFSAAKLSISAHVT